MVFVALGLYIYKNHANHIGGVGKTGVSSGGGGSFMYMRLDSKPASPGSSGGSGSGESILPLKWSNLRNVSLLKRLLPSAFLILCVGLQTVLSSILWNYSLIAFSNILETDVLTGKNEQVNKRLKWLKCRILEVKLGSNPAPTWLKIISLVSLPDKS